MSTQFEFRLKGVDAPAGELDAHELLAIVKGLQEVAHKIGRVETDAEPTGRAPKKVRRLADLTISMAAGSTRLRARRTGSGMDALDLELAEEMEFDRQLREVLEGVAADRRPGWVDDSLARAAGSLRAALEGAATEVDLLVDDQVQATFRTADTHRATWEIDPTTPTDTVTFVGTLFAVNLETHRWRVRDDVGHQVSLPQVRDNAAAKRLLDEQVVVQGAPVHDQHGQLTQLRDAVIEVAPPPFQGVQSLPVLTVGQILASAAGLQPGRIEGLTDDESDAFFEAMGL